MDLIIVFIIILILFGGGGAYYGPRAGWYGPGAGNLLWILVVILLVFAVLQYGGLHRFY